MVKEDLKCHLSRKNVKMVELQRWVTKYQYNGQWNSSGGDVLEGLKRENAVKHFDIKQYLMFIIKSGTRK